MCSQIATLQLFVIKTGDRRDNSLTACSNGQLTALDHFLDGNHRREEPNQPTSNNKLAKRKPAAVCWFKVKIQFLHLQDLLVCVVL